MEQCVRCNETFEEFYMKDGVCKYCSELELEDQVDILKPNKEV